MKKRILVAEDDKSILLLEKRLLEGAGYEVHCATSGDMALEMVRMNRYALVVADVMMPGLDGFDLTKEIFKIYKKNVPVLIVTAMNEPLKAAHEREARPMSALQKPFTSQAFLTAVRLLEAQIKEPESRRKPPKPEKEKKEKMGWFGKLFKSSKEKKK